MKDRLMTQESKTSQEHLDTALEQSKKEKYVEAYSNLKIALALTEGNKSKEQKTDDASLSYYRARIYFNLIDTAVSLRAERAARNQACFQSIFLLCCLWPQACCSDTEWVDDREIIEYSNKGLKEVNSYINKVEESEKINLSTDKASLKDEVRKNLAKAYNLKGCFFAPAIGYTGNTHWCSCCRREGVKHRTKNCCSFADVLEIRSTSTAVSNFKLATDMNPKEDVYRSNYETFSAIQTRGWIDQSSFLLA